MCKVAKVGRVCLKVRVSREITCPVGVFFVWIVVIFPEVAMFFFKSYIVRFSILVDSTKVFIDCRVLKIELRIVAASLQMILYFFDCVVKNFVGSMSINVGKVISP